MLDDLFPRRVGTVRPGTFRDGVADDLHDANAVLVRTSQGMTPASQQVRLDLVLVDLIGIELTKSPVFQLAIFLRLFALHLPIGRVDRNKTLDTIGEAHAL